MSGRRLKSILVAHYKDRRDEGLSNVKFERNTPGVYPVLLEFTYADQDRGHNLSASDSTLFQLIHKPEPKPFPARRPEPIRKPLKPRAG